MGSNSATLNIHLNDAGSVTVNVYPVCEAGPFVAVELGRLAAVMVHDLAVLDALAAQVAVAREALARLLPGQDPLPDADQVEPLPLVVAR